ncbi:non-ribosomal peptide synthetase, partial [Nocardia terpenica]|uniref:condensation domain-containing protein n=1 Tax=Nocardia terpenica TaxID=455432 RepID=UPI002FE12F24
DSIVAIRLVSRARAAGLVFGVRDVFRYRTAAELATVAEAAEDTMVAEPAGAGIGELPATPVMRSFAARGGSLQGFHQSLSVPLPAGLAEQDLLAALQAVLDHHDALRMRSTLAPDEPVCEVLPVGSVAAGSVMCRVDVAGVSGTELEAVVAEQVRAAQARLAPADAVMVQAVWFDAGPDAAGVLHLLVHHWSVDGVSWRILLPDMQAAVAAVMAGDPVVLAPVATSLRRWSQRLAEHAGTRGGELGLWQRIQATPDPLIGARALDPARDTATTMQRLVLQLPATVTGPLLGAVPAAFHGEINDVLLAALARAIRRWRGSGDAVLVDVEGHGRQEFAADLDLSRTVGWFTTVYPVCLDPGDTTITETVKRVKEHLRAIPDKGIGYGLLRYLNPDTAAQLTGPDPQIGFNYLGRFGSEGFARKAQAGVQAPAGPDAAMTSLSGLDAGMSLAHVVEVNAITEDSGDGGDGPVLSAVWSWAGDLIDQDRVRQLGQAWFAELTELVAAVAAGAGGHTVSDFPLVTVDQAEIEALETEHAASGGLAELLPLSPLQQGLAFHAQYEGVDVYTVQLVFELTGGVDVGLLRRAIAGLLDRHANLRAGFRHAGDGTAYQVIAAAVDTPLTVVDVSDAEDPETAAVRVAETERARPFDLTRPPLLRFVLIMMGSERWRLVLVNHHILLDGWSMPLLLNELFVLYANNADVSVLAPVLPYRRYLAWIAETDRDAARQAWQQALAGISEPTLVAPARQASVQVPEQCRTELDQQLTQGLETRAREWAVTVNTVLQAAWGVLLAIETGRDDVVFGSVVSGRPPELAGVETMVGLFINTVPVRVRLHPDHTLAQLVVAVQDQQAALLAHHHLGLTDIQQVTGLGQLFDTLAVYEN